MAIARRLKASEATPSQLAKLKKAAKKYGVSIEEVPMTKGGLIVWPKSLINADIRRMIVHDGWADCVDKVTNQMIYDYEQATNKRKLNVNDTASIERQMLAMGWVDNVDEITDELREEYIEAVRDDGKIDKETLEHVKKKFASLRK